MVKHISLTNKTTRIRNISTLMKVIRAFDENKEPSFWKTPESRHEKEVTVYWCNCRGRRNIYRSEILVRMKSRILWMSRDWMNGSRTHNFNIKDYNMDEFPFDTDDFEFEFTGDFLDACKLIMDIKTIQDEYYGI